MNAFVMQKAIGGGGKPLPVIESPLSNPIYNTLFSNCNFVSGEFYGFGECLRLFTEINKIQFYLSKSLPIEGTLYARIYATSGVMGSTAIPTGSVLASSNGVSISSLPEYSSGSALIDFNFSSPYQPSGNTCIVIESTDKTGAGFVYYGHSAASTVDIGNKTYKYNSNWLYNAQDLIYYIS